MTRTRPGNANRAGRTPLARTRSCNGDGLQGSALGAHWLRLPLRRWDVSLLTVCRTADKGDRIHLVLSACALEEPHSGRDAHQSRAPASFKRMLGSNAGRPFPTGFQWA